MPKDIKDVLYLFCHQVRTFNIYNKKKFQISNNEQLITPIGKTSDVCNGYMIFPTPNGFRRGIHEWTIKYIENKGDGEWSYKSIGVVSYIDNKWISKGIGSNPWPSKKLDKYDSV